MTVLYFITGIGLGTLLVWLLYFSARREIVRIEEEKQLLQQEKHIVIEFMHNLVEAIGEGVEREKLYQKIVHTAILSTGAISACLFELTEDNQLKGMVTEGLFPPLKEAKTKTERSTRARFINDIFEAEVFEMGEGIIGSTAESRVPLLIESAEGDSRVVRHKDPTLAINSLIVVPIEFRKKLLGVLALANPTDTMPFTQNDFSLAQSLAEQAGMAIHNANLMNILIEKNKLDFELTLASNIQNLLLPRSFPKHPKIEIDAYYRPAQKVGGDLYDVFELKDNRIGIVIADVSGKGIPASLLMAICQTNIHHFAQAYDSPAEVLRQMNREMHSEMRQDMFITITYAIIDGSNDKITLARAGHELPLIFKGNEKGTRYEAKQIRSEGIALGMVPSEVFDAVIEDVDIEFLPNELFVLYTDGITEATGKANKEFGVEELISTIEPLRDATPTLVNQTLIRRLEDFSESDKNTDDLTLVAIKHI